MPRLIFWDEDTQHDFISPEGLLYVPGAEALRPELRALTEYAHARSIPIVATADDHLLSDPEISTEPDWAVTFPPHCMHGTPGQQKIIETTLRHPLVLEPMAQNPTELSRRVREHRGDFLILKHALDTFSNPNSIVVLHALSPEAVVVYGVATDFCDRLAIEGLLRERPGARLFFITDAARAIQPARGDALLREWTRRGVRLITTKDVLGGRALEAWL